MKIDPKKIVKQIEKYSAIIILFLFLLFSLLTGIKIGKMTALLISSSALPEKKETFPKRNLKKIKRKDRANIQDYSLLLSFNPFNPSLTSNEMKISEETLEETSLNLSLIGTLVGRKSVAIIKNNKNNSTNLYSEGDIITGENAIIYRIEPTRVIIKRGEKLESLELFEKFEVSSQSLKPSVSIPEKRRKRRGKENTPEIEVKKVGENYFEIERGEIEKATSNLGMMMTQARIVPNIVMGEIKGYKIFAIKPGSIYDKIGLRNGDVIERINGIELKTPEDALQFFKELRNENQFVIDIDRNGEKLTFTYSIR